MIVLCILSIVYCTESMDTEPIATSPSRAAPPGTGVVAPITTSPNRAAPPGIGVVGGMHISLCKCNGT